MEDTRSLKDLAREALNVQNACNLSGVVHAWSRSITRLRALLWEQLGEKYSTDQLNEHPVNKVWADKVAHLTDTQGSTPTSVLEAYAWCHQEARQ